MTAGAGFGAVSVTLQGATSNSILLDVAATTIFSIAPSNGPSQGGYDLTTVGSSFGPATSTVTVCVGATATCTVTVHQHTQLVCTMSAGSSTQQLRVTVLADSNSVPFVYDAPAISSVGPTTLLSTLGGTIVTLNGTSFGSSGS